MSELKDIKRSMTKIDGRISNVKQSVSRNSSEIEASQVLRDLRADGKKGYFRGTRLVIIKDGTPPQQDDSNNL
nr:hypothetical protein BaRGS_003554 [Batillaria attramentaria]KAG5701078.1 hypothetical protein BaRGS_008799 [Batillaria attramentaria]